MIVIAENLNTRNMAYMKAVTDFDPETIKRLSGELVNAGADIINIQCSLDGSGDEEMLPKVSAGLDENLKSRVNSSCITYMAGAGLDAALVDILDTEIMKTVYLIRSFRDEIIFSEADLEGTK
ncbi:hypothetical protein MNBD_NITROSPIRAE03-1684 [hydrothermal vent metagenome]|uniref:Pterin-binding domain-containing protein n=1 Tax=hydrothermal vent metagenome TaxID=652676 RepID=A0A3B1CVU5_9ZZZZ